MISGSFRAFDRRPLEPVTRETRPVSAGASTSSHVTTVAEKESSSETSHSGGDHSDFQENIGQTDVEMVDGLEQPLWEWEKLDLDWT